MDDDGTIRLKLRVKERGITGDAELIYSPTHAMYNDVFKHLNGLKPGETKAVPPWPDQ